MSEPANVAPEPVPASPEPATPPVAPAAPAGPPSPQYARREPHRKRPLLLWGCLALLVCGGLALIGFMVLGALVSAIATVEPPRHFEEELISGEGPDKVVVLEAKGVIMDEEDSGPFGAGLSMVQRLTRQLKRAREDDAVKALVLAVDSPGGGVTASDVLCNEVRKTQAAGKKVVVHMGDLCASGGYYVSAPADWIMASATTITGSISVIAHFLDASTLLEEKLGLKSTPIKSGPYKDIGSPFRPMKPEEKAMLQAVVDELCRRFEQIVADGRAGHGPLPKDARAALEAVHKLADGRVFSAQQALANGLVDAIGYREEAYEKAQELAGLTRASVVRYKHRMGLLGLLAGEVEGRVNINAGVQVQAGDLAKPLIPRVEFRWYPGW